MAENYTRLWEAFLGGEYEGADTTQDYLDQTQDFYKEVVGPSFFGEGSGFGDSQFEGYLASFDPKVLQQAEETFRSEIGDPYTGDDPFSWEKISRYDTSGGADSRVQQLLESELYGQGKFLGGQTGADYGTATAKGLEAYSSGLRGERESLTYEGLTGQAGIASGTGGSVLRSGESTSVAEDVLIEAYKKAKTLGADYREGSEGIEQTLSEDLDTALTTYLDTIDVEKSRWYDAVMGNVHTFRTLDMGGEDVDWTSEAIAEKLDTAGYKEWGCGYGQEWSQAEGKCVDTADYSTELAGAKFREDAACGIGEIYDEVTGACVVRKDLDLTEDAYGYLCPPDDPGLLNCGKCGEDCYAERCLQEEEMGPDGYCIPIEDGDRGRQCPQGQIKTDSGDCIDDPRLGGDVLCRIKCPEGCRLDSYLCECFDEDGNVC